MLDSHSHLSLVLGGSRSGKSRYAEDMVRAQPAPWVYLATAQAFDAEMEARIAEHRARRGEGWRTVEAPLALPEAIRDAPAAAPVLADCLTVWLSNLMLGGHDVAAAIDNLDAALAARDATTVLVSNEVGLSIVPDNPLGRAFRDAQGRLNQRIARQAARVVFMVAGLPMVMKDET
ncbi:bifunctional adenosylcobinamide kinase/adenosylcobinamide-phosphate guanylyltransferase [Microbaculum sp. FT89]|uniref:bifunctional adenosylcobinamide kinase/adenosylcobinamide-phosphate guanylyltransferase n=1 Tax=Microbaculum sp. FT89 TaxID=3447298 RepID=UPI003F53B6AA